MPVTDIMSNSGAVGGPPSNPRQIPSNPSNPSNSATSPGPRPIFDQKPMKNSKFSWPPRRSQQPFTLGIAMGAKMYLKKPTGRRRRPMKILLHPAPRQIPSNSVKFWRPVGPPRQIPSNSGGPSRPPSNSVKFRQNMDPARALTIPP